MRLILLAAVAALVLPMAAQAEDVAAALPQAEPSAAMDVETPQADAAPLVEDRTAKGPPRALLERPWLKADAQRPWFTPLPARQMASSAVQ